MQDSPFNPYQPEQHLPPFRPKFGLRTLFVAVSVACSLMGVMGDEPFRSIGAFSFMMLPFVYAYLHIEYEQNRERGGYRSFHPDGARALLALVSKK